MYKPELVQNKPHMALGLSYHMSHIRFASSVGERCRRESSVDAVHGNHDVNPWNLSKPRSPRQLGLKIKVAEAVGPKQAILANN